MRNKCVIKQPYIDRKRIFAGLAHSRLKWAVCCSQCNITLLMLLKNIKNLALPFCLSIQFSSVQFSVIYNAPSQLQ